MRTRSAVPGALALLALLLAACDPGGVCQEGETRACYSGPEGTAGVGRCLAGRQGCSAGRWAEGCEGEVVPGVETCDGRDDDCDGSSDENLKNACGGCGTLGGTPGAPCEECGTLRCEGPEAVRCEPLTDGGPGTSCWSGEGCEGSVVCRDRVLRCAAPMKNACGKCGGEPVAGIGEPCVGDSGCGGQKGCDEGGDQVVCLAPARNACGVCGGPVLVGLAEVCSAGGCQGKKACDASGAALVCDAKLPNQCGVCGGPELPQVAQECTAAGCPGRFVCATDGATAACSAPVKNNCGVCGKPNVPGIGTACSAANGCPGEWRCNGAGEAAECLTTLLVNECGKCATEPLPALGKACTAAPCLPGTFQCDAAGTGLVCSKRPNNCGVCGPPDVADLGKACVLASGCRGKLVCAPSGDAVGCDAAPANQCGICGGPDLPRVGQDCTANACPGKFVCDADGAAATCDAPSKNNCGACGKPNVSGLGAACLATNGCPGERICNLAGDGTECFSALLVNECGRCAAEPLLDFGKVCTVAPCQPGTFQCDASGTGLVCGIRPNNCGRCGLPDVADLGKACVGTSGCPGKLVCAASGDAVTCNAPDACPGTDHLVISELANQGPGGTNDEFVELHNPTSSSIDASGLTLWYRASTGSFTKLATLPTQTIIGAGRYRLIGRGGTDGYAGSPAADQTYSAASLSASVASIWLLNWTSTTNPAADLSTSHASVVDMLGWGTASPAEGGRPTLTHPAAGSLERKAHVASTLESMSPGGADATKGNGHDSNDNTADFVIRAVRDPQGSASPVEP